MSGAVVPAKKLAPVVLVLGKGGVGKTTVAASLAVLEAETHGLAVLVEFGDGLSGKRALAGAHKNVEHIVIKPEESLQRGATPLFGSATIAKLAMGNFAMKSLLRAAPAVRELAMLESVRQIGVEHPGVRIVVDMPATGHSLAWLRVPQQGKDLLAEGPLFAMCDRLSKELIAPGCCSLVVVTLPEALVLEETLELCASVVRDSGLAVDRIVVNRVPLAVSPHAIDEARGLIAAGNPLKDSLGSLVQVLETRWQANQAAMGALETLQKQKHMLWRLPLAPVDPSAKDVARWLRNEGAP